MNTILLDRVESTNCSHEQYALIFQEIEEDIEMNKYIETYMCELCNKTGILIYYVPADIDWFDNVIELNTQL